VIGEPAYVTGNSSGGLLTTWLAANEPDLVMAIVLEDPPLFSAEYPEIRNTIAYKSFTTSHTAIENGYNDDFLNYWIENSVLGIQALIMRKPFKIKCPTLLLHANYEYTKNGILNGAMFQEQADQAASLIPNCEYRKIDSLHVVNLEHPDEVTDIIEDFFLKQS